MTLLAPLLLILANTPAAPVPVELRGNLVMPEEVYRAVLALPAQARADEATAQKAQAQLESFLHRAGYELARVEVTAVDGALVANINEGRLEKVVFRGRLTFKTLQFKISLSIPHNVYNAPALRRHVSELAKTLSMPDVQYVLVRTQDVEHRGPQVEDLGTIGGKAIVHSQEPYELHFSFDEDWQTGFGLDLRSSYFDGLEGGLNYQGASVLFDRDRLRLEASGGAGIRASVAEKRYYPAFSRTAAAVQWWGPSALFQPRLALKGEFLARQRRDLNLENYYGLTGDASLHLELTTQRLAPLSIGVGARYVRLFGFEPAPGLAVPFSLSPLVRFRPYLALAGEWVLEENLQRQDRRHFLRLDARQFFAIEDPFFGEADLQYQKVVEFGWHDLWLRGKAYWLWGEVPFHDERMLAGSVLRGVFGDAFVHRAAGASVEFRFSLTRDLFKLSFFHDVAAFGEFDRTTGTELPRVGSSFGAGFHALIEGMLQLDLYFAFGFNSSGRFDSGVNAVLQKVF